MRILRRVVGVNSRNCCFLPFFRELMLNFGESLSTGIRDPDANDFERLAASLGCLALRCCETSADKVGEHSACESVGAQQRLGEPALIDGEQLQRSACFRGEAHVVAYHLDSLRVVVGRRPNGASRLLCWRRGFRLGCSLSDGAGGFLL